MFEGGAIHPFNSPLPATQNGKRNLKIFKTTDYRRKRKGIHQLTLRMRFRLAPYLRKPPPIFASGKHFVQLYHWQTSHTQER